MEEKSDKSEEKIENSVEGGVPEGASPSDKELNFKALREKVEHAEKALEEYKAEMQPILQAVKNPPEEAPPPSPPVPDVSTLADDDLIEARHYRDLEKRMDSIQSNVAISNLRSKYNDFEEVVNQENLNKLKDSHPELYGSLDSNRDAYTAGSAAYQMLKAMGYGKKEEGAKYDAERAQLERNNQAPSTYQTAGSSSPLRQLGKYGELTKEQKQFHANNLLRKLGRL